MADQKDNKDSPGPIPEGWVSHTKFKNALDMLFISSIRCDIIARTTYLCPATEQEFYTYEDLMRYEFEENMKKEGQS
ncbi:hypothetical protein GOBAR_AA14823 [Gossypium barbadense]|uniref:Uncharacterized protein n=1 Tax=Gossypium barbadense TaxID=3634 RepID=A0A2P5XRC0_GOSBA|nr:hypothetical protein GOBAR_AA14823 [Gossypium barbadense]